MTTPYSFDADALKEIRDHVRTFIKLDLTYLAALGAIITALKIGRTELLELTAFFWPLAIPFIGICAVDVSIDAMLFQNWMTARATGVKFQLKKLVHVLLAMQSKLHFLFFIFLLIFIQRIAVVRERVLTELETKAEIQEAVELFINKKNVVPRSFNELIENNPNLISKFKKFDANQMKIEVLPNKKYKIIFSGNDNKFDTEDDWIYTDSYQIRDVWKNLKKSDNEATSDK